MKMILRIKGYKNEVKGRGLMDKASGYGPEDCGFKSHRLCSFFIFTFTYNQYLLFIYLFY